MKQSKKAKQERRDDWLYKRLDKRAAKAESRINRRTHDKRKAI
jgi:hypothetical protein